MKVLSLVNQKGGVAKTTTAIALADGFARRGKKVLLIDFDPQGSLTTSCGVAEKDFTCPQAYRFLGLAQGMKAEVIELKRNLDLITADSRLELANAELMTKIYRESFLRRAIDSIPKDLYDYVILDSSPSLSMITINVLAASDHILIPVKPEFGSFKGIDLLLENIKAVRMAKPGINILGFVVTMAQPNRSSTKESVCILEEIAENNKTVVFNSHIRLAVAAADAPSHGKSIFDYAPSASVANDYEALCQEILVALEG